MSGRLPWQILRGPEAASARRARVWAVPERGPEREVLPGDLRRSVSGLAARGVKTLTRSVSGPSKPHAPHRRTIPAAVRWESCYATGVVRARPTTCQTRPRGADSALLPPPSAPATMAAGGWVNVRNDLPIDRNMTF